MDRYTGQHQDARSVPARPGDYEVGRTALATAIDLVRAIGADRVIDLPPKTPDRRVGVHACNGDRYRRNAGSSGRTQVMLAEGEPGLRPKTAADVRLWYTRPE